MTVLEPAQVPRAFQQAFHLMRSGRPGPVLIDLPFDVQMAEIEFDIDAYEPLPVYKPQATRAQIEKALDVLAAAERRSEEHTSELQSRQYLVCRLLLEKKKTPTCALYTHYPRHTT